MCSLAAHQTAGTVSSTGAGRNKETGNKSIATYIQLATDNWKLATGNRQLATGNSTRASMSS